MSCTRVDPQQCPHCRTWCLKDDACNYVVCGRDDTGRFRVGAGCGRPFCYFCGGKLCGRMFDPATGALLNPDENHDHPPGPARDACAGAGFCPGGHNAHKRKQATATATATATARP